MTKKIKKVKHESISKLKKKADKVFSVWIRNRDKACFTCGAVEHLQCGHFVSRSWSALRYSEVNCHAQCSNCNIWRRGNYSVYALKLTRKYGPQILEELEKKKVIKQFKASELQEIIEKYQI